MHPALSLRAWHLERIEAIGRDSQLAVSRPVGRRSFHWRRHECGGLTIAGGPLDRAKQVGVDRTLERCLGIGQVCEVHRRVADDLLQYSQELRSVLIRKQPDVYLRGRDARDDVGLVGATETGERYGVAENRV